MWSVAAPRSAQAPRDPAPSKWAYRMHRWMLTPALRRLVTFWLPVGVILGGVGLWVVSDANQARLAEGVARLRASVEARPEFSLAAMKVTGASDDLTAQVRKALPVDFPISRFELDLEQMRQTVADLPAVERAALRVGPGGILEISVLERIPVAVWRSPEGLKLVDAGGTVTGPLETRAARSDLPLIAGQGADRDVAEAMAILDAAGPLAPRLRGLLRRGDRRWDVILDRDQVVMLPGTGAVQAFERVVALAQAGELLERDLIAVDMRVGHRPTLRLSPSAAEHLREARIAVTKEN